MAKKTQVSIFLIIGFSIILVLSLAAFGWTMFIRDAGSGKEDAAILEIISKQLQGYVDQCLKDSMDTGAFLSAAQGGIIFSSLGSGLSEIPHVDHGPIKISYWYKDGKDISPDLSKVEKDLSAFMLLNVSGCLDFSGLQTLESAYITSPQISDLLENMSHEEIMEISINEEDIGIKFNYEVKLEKGKAEKTIAFFQAEPLSPLGRNFRLAKKILEDMKTQGGTYYFDKHCQELYGYGRANIYSTNNIIKILDYKTYYLPEFDSTFMFQFKYEGLPTAGYCLGGFQ